VTIVQINRPQYRNAVDKDTGNELRDAFHAFDADPTQCVAVLSGIEGVFCSGFDLKYFLEHGASIYDPSGPGMMGPTRETLSKPVIAAVEGYAVAGGLELALWCDVRIASKSAVFGVFCRRWGVPLIDGGTVRLPRVIGSSRAMDMILSGRAVHSEEALQFGLANYVVPEGTALETAINYAQTIASFPQECMRADRASAMGQWSLGEVDALRVEAVGGSFPLRSGDVIAGVTKFVAGRGRHGRPVS
jgi:enoyl-CoA hydratase